MRELRLTILVLIISFGLNAQVELPPSISQYMLNPLSTNPGYAGFYDMTTVSNLFRTGISSGQKNITNTFNLHSSLPVDNLGAGINVNYNKVGITTALNIDLSLSYKLTFGDNKLSFGVQGSLFNAKSNFSRLEFISDEHEGLFTPENANEGLTRPNFGAGVIYSGRKFFGGFSVPRIIALNQTFNISTAGEDGSEDFESTYKPYFILTGGFVISPKHSIDIKPSFMTRYVEGRGLAIDLNTSILFKKVLWGGISLRNSLQNPEGKGLDITRAFNSIALIGQVQATEKIKVGLSYDLPLRSDIYRGLNGFRHPLEVVLNYNIATFEEQGIHTFLY